MQHIKLPDGGFILHKLPCHLGNGLHLSAWYDVTGKLIDAERLTKTGAMRNVWKGGAVWDHAARYGKHFANMKG